MSFLSTLFGRKKKKEDIPISRLPEEPKTELPVPRGNTPITQKEKESKTELRVPEEASMPPDTPLTLPKEPVRKETVLWKTGDVILNNYDIESVITSGGMGTVYITSHRNWKVKIAIKSPHKEMLDHPSLFQMVVKEAEAWTDLGLHPNIAYCYFVRNIGEIPHIFVEYVDGGNLKQWIEEGRCNDLKTGLDLAIQFCHGMAYAHSKGMIHKDIKPGNILMTKDGILKVTDFGLVQRGTDEGNSLILYTEPYASPEQMSDAPIVGPESDLYSFGVCLWEMFLGRRPRPNAWNNNPIPDPKTIDSSLPDSLARLLTEMVSLDRNTRIALGGFDRLKEQFKTIYQNLFHEPSPHSELEQVDLEADSLNNRGVSYLELGKIDEAVKCFTNVLSSRETHLEATYNLALVEWRRGRLDDEAVLKRIEGCLLNPLVDKARVAELLASIHFERLDGGSAESALRNFPDKTNSLLSQSSPHELKCIRTFECPSVEVVSAKFTGNAKKALSGQADGTLRLWDVDTGNCLWTVTGHKGRVLSIDIDASEKVGLTGGDDGTVRLWDIERGECRREFFGHEDPITCVMLFDQGRKAISGCSKGIIKIWDVMNGECLQTIMGHEGRLKTIFISSDAKEALAVSADTTVKKWDLETGACSQICVLNALSKGAYTGFALGASDAWISPNGFYAVTTDTGMGFFLYKIGDKEDIVFRTLLNCHQIVFSPDSEYFITSRGDGNFSVQGDEGFILWHTRTGQMIRRLHLDSQPYHWRILDISTNNEYALAFGGQGNISLFHLHLNQIRRADPAICPPRTYSEILGYKTGLDQALSEIKNTIDKGYVSQAYTTFMKLWQEEGFSDSPELLLMDRVFQRYGKNKEIRSLVNVWSEAYSDLNSVAISSDGQYVVFGGNSLGIHNFVSKNSSYFKVEGVINSVAVCSDKMTGEELVLAGGTKLKLFNLKTHKGTELLGHSDAISSVDLSSDGWYAASGSKDNTIKIWNIFSRACVLNFEVEAEPLCVRFSPEGRYIAVGVGNKIKLWTVEEQRPAKIFSGHEGPVTSLAFSPDGMLIVTGSEDKLLRIWEVNTGQCLKVLEGHSDAVTTVLFCPQYQHVLSGSRDGDVRLWDIISGSHKILWHGNAIQSLAISSHGEHLVVATKKPVLSLRHDPFDFRVHALRLIWTLDIFTPADWDEGLTGYVDYFLNLTKGMYDEEDLQLFLNDLSHKRGYGWVRQDSVRAEIRRKQASENWASVRTKCLSSSIIYYQALKASLFEAEELSTKGLWAQIIELCNHILSLTLPTISLRAPFLRFRGIAYEETGQHELALNDLNGAEQLNANASDAYALLYRGNAHRGLGHHKQAIEDYSKAVKLNHRYSQAYYNRALAYLDLNMNNEAEIDFKQAMDINPELSKICYFYRGQAHFKLSQYRQAIECFNRALARGYQSFELYFSSGSASFLLGQDESATECLMKAIELNPTSWPALWVRGLAYHRLHRFEQASDDFAKVSTLNPDHEEVHLYLGHAHHNLGRYTEAINSLNKMIEINPQDPRAYYRRALTHQKLGRLIESLDDFNKAFERNCTDDDRYYQRGNLLYMMGNYEQAIADFDKCIELNPDDIPSYYARGMCNCKLNRKQEATRDFRYFISHKNSSQYPAFVESAKDRLKELDPANMG